MKRFAVQESEMVRVLMLMSHGQEQALPLQLPLSVAGGHGDRAPERVFVCKTCNRVFPSFQALGGHRASHKKPRLDGDGGDPSLAKPKLHGCSICGLEFAIGQALGGHMRLMSHGQEQALPLQLPLSVAGGHGDRAPERVFVCKTCNRVFPSFQALGGHRASHKKLRLDGDGGDPSLAKPKVHGCSICGLEFAIGQALGGHMRRHRAMTGGMPPATTAIVVDKKPDDVVSIIHHDGGVKRGGLWLDPNHPPCDDGSCDADDQCAHNATAGITFHQFLDTGAIAVDCLGY